MFISSVNGRLSLPMRMELRPWHMPVVIVEPAQTDTDMWQTAETELAATEAALTLEHRKVAGQP